MIRTITVKGITIGEGAPKICVPMVGRTMNQLREEAALLQEIDLDLVEWRVDCFEEVEDLEQVKAALSEIRQLLPKIPLILTFRSSKEGGQKEIAPSYYVALNRAAAESGMVDVIDVELLSDGKDVDVAGLIEFAHSNHVFVIVSNHDFAKTPSTDEIVSRLCRAQQLGADLPKIAVMPNSPLDVLTLLEATYIMKSKHADRPIITMSMAGQGMISRLSGEVFGSALTFGAGKEASAPGQLEATELRRVLSLISESL